MDADLMLATPLSEDTPRSAFAALSAGLPIAAFDLSYYQDLESSGAVVTVPWPDVGALAGAIQRLDGDRALMQRMVGQAVEFAHANTQAVWMDRRMRWTWDVLNGTEAAPTATRSRRTPETIGRAACDCGALAHSGQANNGEYVRHRHVTPVSLTPVDCRPYNCGRAQ